METTSLPKTDRKLRVAVPYYGTLTQPQTGLAHLFFLAEIEEESQRYAGLKIRVWNMSTHPRLADWFREQNISGLICRESDSPHLQELKRNGFWVAGGRQGDAEEMVSHWISSRRAASCEVWPAYTGGQP